MGRWNLITLEKHEKLQEILKAEINPAELRIQFLSVMEDKPREKIEAYTISKVIKKMRSFHWYFQSPKLPLVKRFRIGLRRFKVVTDIRELTAGEYIDLNEFVQQFQQHGSLKDVVALFVKQPKSLFRKQLTHDQKAELFSRRLTMDKVLPLSVFFCGVYQSLMENIADSLRKTQNQELKDLKEALQSIGHGSLHSIISQIQTFLNGKEYTIGT